jgi:hypothetical protein
VSSLSIAVLKYCAAIPTLARPVYSPHILFRRFPPSLSFPKKPKIRHSAWPTQVADHLVPNQVLGFFEFFRERERGKFPVFKGLQSLHRRRFEKIRRCAACRLPHGSLANCVIPRITGNLKLRAAAPPASCHHAAVRQRQRRRPHETSVATAPRHSGPRALAPRQSSGLHPTRPLRRSWLR